MKELTTTSYAILGLLSLRPWSAYDLAKQMRRSLDLCWPRAERAIYYEPKNLLAHGLVEAKTEVNGRRNRTVYTITLRGRRALRRWLGQPSARPQFESEAVVRALFSEHGSKDDLLAAVRSLREHSADFRAQGTEVIRSYVEGDGPFPQRLHIHALVSSFFVEYIALLERWSTWAEAEVEQWPDTTSPAAFPGASDIMRRLLEEVTARPTDAGTGGTGTTAALRRQREAGRPTPVPTSTAR